MPSIKKSERAENPRMVKLSPWAPPPPSPAAREIPGTLRKASRIVVEFWSSINSRETVVIVFGVSSKGLLSWNKEEFEETYFPSARLSITDTVGSWVAFSWACKFCGRKAALKIAVWVRRLEIRLFLLLWVSSLESGIKCWSDIFLKLFRSRVLAYLITSFFSPHHPRLSPRTCCGVHRVTQ